MIVAISQPTFLPWAGYFDLIARADVFVLLDTVQFERRSWQCRNRLLQRNGEVCWLSVPVRKASRDTAINAIDIAEHPPHWRQRQRRTVVESLGHAPAFAEVESLLSLVYDQPHRRLAVMNETFIRAVADRLAPDTRIVRASELSATGRRTGLLLAICQELGATRYYSSAGSADYLDADRHLFDALGIDLHYQQWDHPIYPQQSRAAFTSHLCVLDALANVGQDALAEHYAHD